VNRRNESLLELARGANLKPSPAPFHETRTVSLKVLAGVFSLPQVLW
jgi:hypothetical protein